MSREPAPPTVDSAAVLAVQVANLDQKVDAIHLSLKEDLSRIEQQTRKTNGRVTSHDERLAELRGTFKAFGYASPFVVAIVAAALQRFLG